MSKKCGGKSVLTDSLVIAAAIVMILSTVIVTLPVMANTSEDILKELTVCASVTNDTERLACYDRVARSLGLTPPASVEGKRKWQVSVKTNPLDDSTTVALMLFADSGTSTWGDRVSLILRWQSNKLEAYINWHDYLEDGASVTWRVGTKEARRGVWGLSTDNEATFYPYDVTGFIQELLEATRFVAQVTPYEESPITAIFDITGLKDVIRPLEKACGWQWRK